jgi:hypothetical protein
MINYGGELIRISPKDSKKLEYSKNKGLTWSVRCSGSSNYGNIVAFRLVAFHGMLLLPLRIGQDHQLYIFTFFFALLLSFCNRLRAVTT